MVGFIRDTTYDDSNEDTYIFEKHACLAISLTFKMIKIMSWKETVEILLLKVNLKERKTFVVSLLLFATMVLKNKISRERYIMFLIVSYISQWTWVRQLATGFMYRCGVRINHTGDT